MKIGDLPGLGFLGLRKAAPTAGVARPAQVAAQAPVPADVASGLPSGFQLVAGDVKFEIPAGRHISVGRLADSDLPSADSQMSRQHAFVYVKDGQVFVMDRGSSNGTFIGNQRTEPEQWHALKPGQMVRMGGTQFQLQAPSSQPAPPPARLVQQGLSTGLQTALAGVGGLSGPVLGKVIDFRELVADPGQQQQTHGPLIPDKPNSYWQNNAQARLVFRDYLARGDFSSVEEFKSVLKQAHTVAVEGSDGQHRYYGGSRGVLGPEKLPAGQFHRGVVGGIRENMNTEVEQLARRYGDPYRNQEGVDGPAVKLDGISPAGLPQNLSTLSGQRHFYPSPEHFNEYFGEMQKRLQRLEKLPHGASQDAVLTNVAEFYHYAANSRPFHNVNNSLFMNLTNDLLRRHGLSPAYHGILDHAAHRLQPASFNNYFKDWVLGAGKIELTPTPYPSRVFTTS